MTRYFEEKTLLFAVKSKKDKDAFAKIYDIYVSELYRFIVYKVSDKETAQDVTSDVFLQAWQYLSQTNEAVQSIRGLLYKIARNKIIDIYRAKAKFQTVSLQDIGDVGQKESVTEALYQKQTEQSLIDAVKQLKQEYQEVILFRYMEEMSMKEIAQAMGKSQTSVRVTLHRAVKKLQTIYKKTSL